MAPGGTSPELLEPLVPAAWLPHLGGWALVAAGLIVNGNGGTVIVRKALDMAGSDTDVSEVTVSIRGSILKHV